MQNRPQFPQLTGIGSLPHASLPAAIRHQEQSYTLLFRPQLATGSGAAGMLSECLPPSLPLHPQPGFGVKLELLIEAPELAAIWRDADPETAPIVAANRDFLAALSGCDRSQALKSQMVGPITLLHSLRDAYSRPLFSAPELRQPVTDWLLGISRLLARDLTAVSDAGLLVVDEPVLGLPGPRDAEVVVCELLQSLGREIRQSGLSFGIHCCSEPPFALLDQIDSDVMFLDACRFAASFTAAIPVLAGMLKRGRRLGLGLIPVIPAGSDFELLPFLDALRVASGLSPDAIVAGLDLSASCGSMMAPVAREEEIARELAAARHVILNWKETQS